MDWLGVHVKKLDLVSLYQLHPMQLLDQDRLKHKGHFQPPNSVVLPDRLVFTQVEAQKDLWFVL